MPEAITKPYIDFQYYSETYGGNSVSEAEFARYEIRSRMQIDRCTFRRVAYCIESFADFEIPSDIKLAQCVIIDYIKSVDDDGGRVIASESVSKHSVSYAAQSYEEKIADIARSYIPAYPWRHRGIGGVYVETGDESDLVQCIL